MKKIKRALALSGGGPAAGLEIGALKAFEEKGVDFDVFTCDCIGSWVACIYNSLDPAMPNKAEELKRKFEFFFVPDDVYKSFPIMRGFSLDFFDTFNKLWQKMVDPDTYSQLVLPNRIMEYIMETMQKLPIYDREILDDVMSKGLSVNPLARLMIEFTYKLGRSGISLSPKSKTHIDNFTGKLVDFKRLYQSEKLVYFNAYNLTKKKIQMFMNSEKPLKDYKSINGYALAAASTILYYIENTEIDGDQYCEGANIDTLNFKDLMKNHPDLDEIWIVKIADYKEIKPPKNILEAASLQVMLPFDTIADDDIKLFKYHLKEEGSKAKVIEIKMKTDQVTYDWSYANLYKGIEVGYAGALKEIEAQEKENTKNQKEKTKVTKNAE